MNKYLILHFHAFGYTTFRVNSYRDLEMDDIHEIVEEACIDYEPMKGETIEIVKLLDSDKEFFLE